MSLLKLLCTLAQMNSADIEIQNQLKCADGPATSVYWFFLPLSVSPSLHLCQPLSFLTGSLVLGWPRVLNPPASASHRLGSQACITMLGSQWSTFFSVPRGSVLENCGCGAGACLSVSSQGEGMEVLGFIPFPCGTVTCSHNRRK